MKSITWKPNIRREIRKPLLAAMETCWVFAVIVFLAGQLASPRPLTALPFFVAYWLALTIGRALPQTRKQWIALRVVTVAIVAVTVLAVVHVEMFSTVSWFELQWLPREIATILTLTRGIGTEHLITAGVLYMFFRGLGFAQRPLTLWFVGFQFRLGIVVFFILFVTTGFVQPSFSGTFEDSARWIFAYFLISLIAVALARIEEAETEVSYGPRWAVTILGGIVIVLFVGWGILQFFNPETVRLLLQPLSFIWMVIAAVVFLLAIPGGLIAGWLVDLLKPFFDKMGQMMQVLTNFAPPDTQEQLKQASDSGVGQSIVEMVKTLAVPAALMVAAFFLLRALNHRMKQYEEEAFIRESAGRDESGEQADRGGQKKQHKGRGAAREIAAESIRRIYAALVARVSDAGLPRRIAETPFEYLPRLKSEYPDAAQDIDSITKAYVAVHYGEKTAEPSAVVELRTAWKRVESLIKTTKAR